MRVDCLHWLLMLWIVGGYIIKITIIEMKIRTVILIIKSSDLVWCEMRKKCDLLCVLSLSLYLVFLSMLMCG